VRSARPVRVFQEEPAGEGQVMMSAANDRDPAAEWFMQGPQMPPVLGGNDVKFLIDGEEAFREMVAVLRSASAPGDFIYLVNWSCDVEFPLLLPDETGRPGPTLRELLEQASASGVMIRALLWKEPDSSQNAAAVAFFNGTERPRSGGAPKRPLANAAAIHDDRGDKPFSVAGMHILGSIPRALGSQHQKILCVFAGGQLTAFCGGVDFDPDRLGLPPAASASEAPALSAERGEGQPLHDVHCRIVGPAAFQLVKIFLQKWNDHRSGQQINAAKGSLIVPPVPGEWGQQVVQIARTYKAGIYRFCPEGDGSAAAMIGHAIRTARRFIYTECQYFTGAPALQAALLAALPVIEHLTIVLTHWELSDLPFVNSRRKKFLRALTANPAHAHKVRIFTLQPGGNDETFQNGHAAHTYAHSKVWIMDDEFAVIGSLNSNQRSWMHDSEVAAGIYDRSRNQFARQLRVKLWQEHLNMQTAEGAEALADGVASAAYWIEPPPGARVRPYDIEERDHLGRNDRGLPFPFPRFIANSDLVWNNIFDPD